MDLNNIAERLNSIEQRLSLIESKLEIRSQANLPEPEAAKLTQQADEIDTFIQPAKAGNWLGIVAVICFVLAAGFIIKLSIQSGWLTPQRQLVLAILFGISLILLGIKLLNTDRSHASLLPAAGAIILYLTAFAAYRLYFLISFQTAIMLTSIISGLCIWLYIKIKHDLYAIIAAIGAFLGPIVLELSNNAIFSLYYYIICSLTFATLSIWVRSRTLTVISAYLAILVTSYIGFKLDQDLLIAVVLALYFFIYTLGTYFHTRITQRQLTEKEAWSLFPVLLIFYVMEYYFIDRIHPGLAPWVSLGFTALLIGLYLYAKKWFPGQLYSSQLVVIVFTTIVCFHSIYLELLPTAIRPWLFVVITLGKSIAAKKNQPKISHLSLFPALVLLLIVGIEYINILSHLTVEFNLSWFIVALAAFASTWLALIVHHDTLVGKDEYVYYLLLGAAHLLAVTGLYQLTNHYSSLAVSAAWLFYAVCVINFAMLRKDKMMAKSALIILAIAAGKALLYDASSTPTIVRILSLILTGAVLYGCGLFIKKMSDWKN